MPELKLLERSVLRDGWLFPIVVTPDNEIIDGFHRWRLSLDSGAFKSRWHGGIPVVRLDVPVTRRKATTVRMNRARGTHISARMSELVRGLVCEDGMDPQQVAEELGMTQSEVEILLQTGIFKARNLDKWRYSQSWIPKDK